MILKGSYSQKATFLCKVCSQKSSGLNIQQLRTLLLWFVRVLLTSECAETVFPQKSNFKISAESTQRTITYLMSSLKTDSEGSTATVDEVEKWLTSTALAVQIIDTVFAFIFYHKFIVKGTTMPNDLLVYFGVELNPETGKVIPDRLLLPLKFQHPLFKQNFDSELLDQSSLMLLNSYFPHMIRGRFYPLFSSLLHGESFSTFCKLITGCNGPTLLVIRDKEGHTFGGFASAKWNFDPNFTGKHVGMFGAQ